MYIVHRGGANVERGWANAQLKLFLTNRSPKLLSEQLFFQYYMGDSRITVIFTT